ncbi:MULTISPECIES: hypothetical protein [Gimesia]|uniref:hypothetical protein n=1 Tax=Gimesia TaxID=1649453 RepID=UPI000C5FB254|nr:MULTISPECIES: hypothetical protein [Gimesia]MAX37095.1 hypothetical protein [Gimesia sp.]
MSRPSDHSLRQLLKRTGGALLVQPGCMCGCSAPTTCLSPGCGSDCFHDVVAKLDLRSRTDDDQETNFFPKQRTQ